MTKEEFRKIIEYLINTNHIPTEFRINKTNAYPFSKFTEYSPAELADKSIDNYKKYFKDHMKKYENKLKEHKKHSEVIVPYKPIEMTDDNQIQLAQFSQMILDRPICIWGACYDEYY